MAPRNVTPPEKNKPQRQKVTELAKNSSFSPDEHELLCALSLQTTVNSQYDGERLTLAVDGEGFLLDTRYLEKHGVDNDQTHHHY
jgi:hypothetical protein